MNEPWTVATRYRLEERERLLRMSRVGTSLTYVATAELRRMIAEYSRAVTALEDLYHAHACPLDDECTACILAAIVLDEVKP